MPLTLEGTVALVTGASRGLGKDIAHGFEAAGARVARVSRMAEYRCDVTKPDEVVRLKGSTRT